MDRARYSVYAVEKGGKFLKSDLLLDRMGMSEEREARIAEGKARAWIILEEHREQALRLTAHLVEHGHLNEPEFLRLMRGE